MSLFHSNRRHGLEKLKFLRQYASVSSENVSKATYPPILDLSIKAVQERETIAFHKKIQALNTVEEKLLALNMSRYYGWESLILQEGQVPYNFLPLVQSVTKTRLHQVDNGCAEITLTEDKLKEVINNVKNQLEKILVYHSKNQRLSHEYEDHKGNPVTEAEKEKLKTDNLIEQINRVVVSNLSREYPHLLSAQVDYKPRIEAFWNVGGLGLTPQERETRVKKKVHEELLDEPSTKWIQYFGSPVLQLRSSLPLPPLGEMATSQTWECKEFPYDPKVTYALDVKRQHGATVPGFWPDDDHKFGLLSVHTRPTSLHADDSEEATHAAAILASYAWLLGQASYCGFTTFNELTYPLCTQSVLTDGRLVSFYAYQMNRCVTWNHNDKDERRNEAYTSGTMELYSSLDGDRITGWNDSALTQLLGMYMKVPEKQEGVDLTPYLDKKESLVQHYQYDKKRAWLHTRYRDFTARRNRHKEPPEIYDWEYIYKVAFETRPMDARKRFFEQGLDPLEERRMGTGSKDYGYTKEYQYDRRYIRKRDRAEGDKRKYEETFYPDIF
ncbi:hypothetical protein M8J76_003423 [Diaphorina citri]|nr:hypothetical protein M8J75_011328 [Diaphorina citri]KAI5736455.1 hypothetical protein M8J76_003423 [Diaphorina citri]